MENEPKRTLTDLWRSGGIEAVVGQRVRELRQARGWSQEELAERLTSLGLQFHQTQIGKLEAGGRPIRLNEASALAAAFDIPLPNLISVPVAGMSDPLEDEITELSLKFGVLLQQRRDTENASRRLAERLSIIKSEVADMRRKLMDLYAQPRATYDLHDPERNRGHFEVSRTQDNLFALRLIVDKQVILLSGKNYEDPADLDLDIEMIRYMAPKLTEYMGDRMSGFQITPDRKSGYYLTIFAKEVPLAFGLPKAKEEVRKDVDRLKTAAPHIPVLYKEIGGAYDRAWLIVASFSPPGVEVEYVLKREEEGVYSFTGKYDGGPGKRGVSVHGGDFYVRVNAIQAIKTQLVEFPGPVFEVNESQVKVPVDVDLETRYYKPSQGLYGSQVDAIGGTLVYPGYLEFDRNQQTP
ncbi:multiprotein-bridging factor 1 family protein [Streptosporangium canum]|uniref:helix-turn-helix domain-containing protein n=1 Tax=Streptosporangium canum TaxID=324952 RepID=UPI0036AA5785